MEQATDGPVNGENRRKVQKTPERKVPAPPSGLAAKGRSVWRTITRSYDLRPDELIVLARICKVTDRIAQLDTIAADSPPIIVGSHGGLVTHPAVTELRQLELALGRLVRVLALPDTDAGYGRQVRGTLSARRSHRAS
jgi:hypothetical protein